MRDIKKIGIVILIGVVFLLVPYLISASLSTVTYSALLNNWGGIASNTELDASNNITAEATLSPPSYVLQGWSYGTATNESFPLKDQANGGRVFNHVFDGDFLFDENTIMEFSGGETLNQDCGDTYFKIGIGATPAIGYSNITIIGYGCGTEWAGNAINKGSNDFMCNVTNWDSSYQFHANDEIYVSFVPKTGTAGDCEMLRSTSDVNAETYMWYWGGASYIGQDIDPTFNIYEGTAGGATVYTSSGNRTLVESCPSYPDEVRWSNATLTSYNNGSNVGNMTVLFSSDNSTWTNETAYADLQTKSFDFACSKLVPNTTTDTTGTPFISQATIDYETIVFRPTVNALTINSSNPLTNLTDTNVLCSFIPISYYSTGLSANITWLVNDEINATDIEIPIVNNTQFTVNFSSTITHRLDKVKCEVNIWDTSYGSSHYNSSIITIENSIPTIPNIILPSNNTNLTVQQYELYCQGSTDLDNDDVYYSIYGDTNNPPTTLLQNTTSGAYNWTFPETGTHWWYCKADDGIGSSNATSTLNLYSDWVEIHNNLSTTLLDVYEGELTYLELNLTYNPSLISTLSSTLLLNETTTITNATKLNTTDYVLSANVYLPVGIINETEEFDYLFNVTYNYVNSTQKTNNLYHNYFNLSRIDFNYCKPSQQTFLNITFKDEQTNNLINATIGSMTLNFSLNSDLSKGKQFTFTNSTNSFNFPFCFTPHNKTIYTFTTFTYLNAIDGYPQKIYTNDLILTNATTNLELQLLPSSSGQYVTFQVVNLAEQTLSGVNVKVLQGGSTVTETTTDAAGAITFFLDPNTQYSIIFSKDDYDSYTYNVYPTQTAYTITLSRTASSSSDNTNYIIGISYTAEPKQDVLTNNTDYNFNFTIDSGTYDLDAAGFRLWNKSNTLLDSGICLGSSGCTAQTTYNTNNLTKIRMEYYWIIDGSSFNQSKTWTVTGNDYDGESNIDWLKKDAETLGDVAFGGGVHGEFTKALIAFIITLIVVGGISYVSGIYSPFAISIETFFMVLIFDFIGFIPSLGLPPNGTPHFITVLMGLITLGVFIYDQASR